MNDADEFFNKNDVIEENTTEKVCKGCGCHTVTTKQEIQAAIEKLEDKVWVGSHFYTHRTPDGHPFKPSITKELLNEGLRVLEKYEGEEVVCCEMHWSQDVGKLQALSWVLEGGDLDELTTDH